MSHASRLPVGIPLEAPPGWRRRSPSPWRPVVVAATVTLLALLFLAIGWISVDPGSGRPPRSLPSLASLWKRASPTSAPDDPSGDEDKAPPSQEPTNPEPNKPSEEKKTTPAEKTLAENKPTEKKQPPTKVPAKPVEKSPEKSVEKPAEKTSPPEKIPEKNPTPATAAMLSFKKDIAPILERACVRCHNANRQQGGVNVSTYDAVINHIMPGKPDASDLLNVIVNGQMPPNMPNAVSAADQKKLRDWITQGAKE
ncbi:MAG: c-type cytochrome domain-containing protein [Gemmataceae bacterium]